MRENARGMMRNFYGKEMGIPQEWMEWQTLIGLGPNEILQSLASEAGKIGQDVELGLSNILVQTGTYLTESLPETMLQLFPLLQEQLAATELKNIFNVPLSLLGVPVAMELAQMEVEAQLALQDSVAQVESMITQFTEHVVMSMQLFIAERINAVENELTMHEQALAKSTQISNETTGGLEKELGVYEPQFDQKKQELIATRQSLYGLWEKVTDLISPLSQKAPVPVINAIEQSTGPTLMAA